MGDGHYQRLGISLACRYWAMWVHLSVGQSDLRCSFDDLDEALAYIAERSDVASGGVWDRRRQRWAV